MRVALDKTNIKTHNKHKYRKTAVRDSRKVSLTVRSNLRSVGCVCYAAQRAGNACCIVKQLDKTNIKTYNKHKYRKTVVRDSRKVSLTVRSNLRSVGCVCYAAQRAGNTCCIVKRRNKIKGARYAPQIYSAPPSCGTENLQIVRILYGGTCDNFAVCRISRI